MIITNSGKAGIKHNNTVVIDKVVFSDFDLSKIYDDEQPEIKSLQGANTLAIVPTVALMSNGHALVQASANASFNVNSAFVFAHGNDDFLLAITESNGSLYEEVSIDAIRKLSFNAIANDLVMASDVNSLVSSAYALLPNGAPSYASDAYNRAISYANSILNSDSALASSYANQAYTGANSYTDSQLSSKADNAELSNYVTSAEASSTTSSINNQLASKVDTSVLSAYVTTEVLTDASSQVNAALQTKANTSDLANYATSYALNTLSSAIISSMANKADINSLSSLATQSQFSAVNQLVNANSNLINKLQSSALQYYGVWRGNVLDLATQPDGIYEMYANQQGCPNNYDGYGFVIKIHNTWNSLLLLFDNNFYQWTNRQGAQGWNGWRQLVDTEMIQGSMIDASSASSHIAFLQSKADTDAGNIINNNKLINSLAAEIDSLKAK